MNEPPLKKLSARLVDFLRAADRLVSTADLTRLVAAGASNARGQVWSRLTVLEKLGAVSRVKAKGRSYWKLKA